MTHRRATPKRTVAFLVLGSLLALTAACGHRMSTDELVAANRKVSERKISAAGDAVAPGLAVAGAGATGGSDGTGVGTTGGSTTGGAATGSSTTGGATTGGSAIGGTTGGGAATASTPGETGPIVIGSVGNYSGIAGPPQAPMVRALQVWAEYVNSKGGLAGRKVQVIVVDDRGDPAQHVAALRDLVENRHVVAFVDNAAALTIASGRQYLESAGVPVIGTACANTTEFESPVMFPQCENVLDFFQRSIQLGVRFSGQKDYGFFTCSEAQTCTDGFNAVVSNGGASKAGASVRYAGRGSLAQPDFTSECEQARSAGVKLMQVVLDPTGVIRFGQSCARQGFNPVFVQGSATVFYQTKDQPGFGNLIVTGQVFNFVGTETAARSEFQSVMKTFYGKLPGPGERLRLGRGEALRDGGDHCRPAGPLHQSQDPRRRAPHPQGRDPRWTDRSAHLPGGQGGPTGQLRLRRAGAEGRVGTAEQRSGPVRLTRSCDPL